MSSKDYGNRLAARGMAQDAKRKHISAKRFKFNKKINNFTSFKFKITDKYFKFNKFNKFNEFNKSYYDKFI
ncbi:unnamed protein product [Caenorhabditis auriculariae]|uniref:Uncharacterized protein n=1 Tax=Caenorhabditis auriculariae TaxID=2777116 RepID=A0A8S1HEU8_9PELO|nr:unnamed protein product [Caenorhabditis auriculariae]